MGHVGTNLSVRMHSKEKIEDRKRKEKKTKLISQLIILDLYFEKRGFLGDSEAERPRPKQIEQ